MMAEISEKYGDVPGLLDAKLDVITATRQDLANFAQLYRQFLSPMYHYLLSRVRDPQEAEDLTAVVFLDAMENFDRYRPIAPFAAWLFTIARRRAADYFRFSMRSRRREVSSLDEMLNMHAEGPDILAQVIEHERSDRLYGLVSALPERDQEILRLRFAAGLEFHEIAAVLGRKESAVKMAFYRLLSRLESEMGEDDE